MDSSLKEKEDGKVGIELVIEGRNAKKKPLQ
jgi:hypothetical protein